MSGARTLRGHGQVKIELDDGAMAPDKVMQGSRQFRNCEYLQTSGDPGHVNEHIPAHATTSLAVWIKPFRNKWY